MRKEEDMKNKRKIKKFCTEFVVLNDVEKDYILGISQALEFAVKKPGQSHGDGEILEAVNIRPLGKQGKLFMLEEGVLV
jgi:hypothetical protein